MGKVVVIIVNWNTGRLLSRCLNALSLLPEKDLIEKVYVIDNSSTDGSIAEARHTVSDWPSVSFITLDKNIGFAAANNLAINMAQKEELGDCHVWLLNPDTEVKPGALKNSVTVLENNPQAGIVGPKLLNTDGSLQPSVRSFPTLPIFILFFTKLNRIFSNSGIWKKYMLQGHNYHVLQAVDQVMGASFLIRNEALKEVGLLDEGYWVWFEEVDYCKRASNKGWQTWYTPEAQVIHHGGASFSQLVGWQRTKPWIKSSLRYAHKHLGNAARLILLTLVPLALITTVPASLTHVVNKQQNSKRL